MSKQIANCIIFAGPTRCDLSDDRDNQALNILWQPPAQRGSIEAVIAKYPTGNIAIVDGLFHHSPAVGHAEIRKAMERGWRVWGLSSMGAIRACEMREQGMHGFGRVYQYFINDEDFCDDEVALLHEPAPTYRACSEPLVHIREALRDLIELNLLNRAEADELLGQLLPRWFGDRTLPLLNNLISKQFDTARVSLIKQQLSSFAKYRIKTHDLRDFLQQRVWQQEL